MPYYARATADDNGGIAIVESDTGTVWTSPGHADAATALEVARGQAAEWNGRDLEIITRLLGLNTQTIAPEVSTVVSEKPGDLSETL